MNISNIFYFLKSSTHLNVIFNCGWGLRPTVKATQESEEEGLCIQRLSRPK